MATLLLSAAGAAAGNALGGAAGAAALGATLGRAAGALAGGLIDRKLMGDGAPSGVEPAKALRLMSAREGAPIARVYGRFRVAGQVIWSTRFRVRTERVGDSKSGGGAQSRYAISLAIALCEGPIDRIGRIWADGKPLPKAQAAWRLHRGEEDAMPDPLIKAVEGEGAAPAYRGLAYLVFEELDLAPFGNRIPQISVEVFRAPARDETSLAGLVRAVALSPGSGEFSLDVTPVRRRLKPGSAVAENVNTVEGRADLAVSLDQLQDEAPNCGAASLVVSWFGDDLRCGHCTVAPRVERRDKRTEPYEWSVAGLSRRAARVVGRLDERPVFGGTPSDRGVVSAIRDMRARGLSVMFYPFLMMEIAPGNGLPDPYGGAEQAAYPWRGRITLDRAPGRAGSADQSAEAADAVNAFFGVAAPENFRVEGDDVVYSGPEEWSLRRMVLHYATLCAAAGGVDAFCIGSELRGLTHIRAARADYPAVAALRALARDVRRILGASVKIGYAADWSEYFGHHPGDGSGDALFHLDPLWSDPEIDFVGIDNYMPLTDWRDGDAHIDAAEADSIYDRAYLASRIEGGEGYDWFYASEADRLAQRRSPIRDEAHGEDWLWRVKDIRNWWSNRHHDRIGGERAAQPTGWAPGMKPIWFTEIGCAAVDKGANQPNLFVDPKSAESALPAFSSGARDDMMQRRFLEVSLDYWRDETRNPLSADGGRMIDTDRCFVWTWDARPWPDFPQRGAVWGDCAAHGAGHWITGRLGAVELSALAGALCAEAGAGDVEATALTGVLDGFAQERVQSARDALAPLSAAFGFDAVESGGRIRFAPRIARAVVSLGEEALCARDDAAPLELRRAGEAEAPGAVRFGWLDAGAAFEPATAEAGGGDGARVDALETQIALQGAQAAAIATAWRAQLALSRDAARFSLPPDRLDLEPGDVVRLEAEGLFRITRIDEGEVRAIESVRATDAAPLAVTAPPERAAPAVFFPGAPEVAMVETRALPDGSPGGLRIGAFAEPWPGRLAIRQRGRDGRFETIGHIDQPSVMGVLVEGIGPAEPDRWRRDYGLLVRLYGGALRPADRAATLAGANLAAVERDNGGWEILQFSDAAMEGPEMWRLSKLLRGQAGSAGGAASAGARFLLLDAAALHFDLAPAEAGEARDWLIGPAALPQDHDAQTALRFAPSGVANRALAPAQLRVTADSAAWIATWAPRRSGDRDLWRDRDGDAQARFLVRVVEDGATRRAEEAAGPEWRYRFEDAAADGVVGPFTLLVCEICEVAGLGDAAEVIVDG